MSTTDDTDDPERKQEFHSLALEAKKFLEDHDIKTFTDTAAGHMAIWCQKHMEADRKQTAKAVVERIRQKCPSDFGQTGPGQPAYFDGRKQGYNDANAAWRAVLKDVEEHEL